MEREEKAKKLVDEFENIYIKDMRKMRKKKYNRREYPERCTAKLLYV